MTQQTMGKWARYLVIVTLVIGVAFHATRLFIGVTAFQSVFTPLVDALFSIPIVLAIVAMILGWRAFAFRGRLEKAIVIVTLGYFILTMPLHLKTWVTKDTSYIEHFPWWYGFVFIGYAIVLLWVWARLRVMPTEGSRGTSGTSAPR